MTLYPASSQRQFHGFHGRPAREKLYRIYLDSAATTLAIIYADNDGTPGSAITNAEILTNNEGVAPKFHAETVGILYAKPVGATGPIIALAPDPESVFAQRVTKNDVFLNVRDFGARGDAFTNDTVAIQKAIDAAGPGGSVFFPVGEYLCGTLTISKGQFLIGSGYYIMRDATDVFGTSPWNNTANMHGTIIRSTVTSGEAIYHMDPVTHTGGGISNMMVVGPGSGTSVGIRIGRDTPSVKAVIAPEYSNVLVANFATGYSMWHVNEGRFYSLSIRGCTKAVSFVHDVNSNSWIGLNMQRVTDGVVMESGGFCYSNTFVSPIVQNWTGTAWIVRGFSNTWLSSYHESPSNPTGMKLFDFQAGSRNRVITTELHCTNPMDFFFSAQADYNTVKECDFHPLRLSLTDNGDGNKFSGDFDPSLVIGGTGINRIVEDRRAGFVQFPSIRIGSAGQKFVTGNGSPEGVITAPVGSWYFRTNPTGVADALYVKLTGTGSTGWVAK